MSVQLVPLGQRDRKVLPEQLVPQVPLVQLVLLVTLEPLVLLVHKAFKVKRVLLGQQEQQALRVQMGQ
jgi:hypothetical protein